MDGELVVENDNNKLQQYKEWQKRWVRVIVLIVAKHIKGLVQLGIGIKRK